MKVIYIFIITGLIVLLVLINGIYQTRKLTGFLERNYNKNGNGSRYIPKKIFQTIADKTKINPKFTENIEYIKRLNPTWEHVLFDDKDIADYIGSNYSPEMLAIYEKINPKYGAARADFFRYLLMYKEGGAYFDIKSAPKIPLDNIILPDDEYILCHWECPCETKRTGIIDGEYQQWHVICRPRHPYLKAVLDRVINNIMTYTLSDGVGKPGVLAVTGPVAYSKAIVPIRQKYSHRLLNTNEYVGFTYNNIQNSHINLFQNKHYSKITEPIILS